MQVFAAPLKLRSLGAIRIPLLLFIIKWHLDRLIPFLQGSQLFSTHRQTYTQITLRHDVCSPPATRFNIKRFCTNSLPPLKFSAPLKLRTYGATQTCLLLKLFLEVLPTRWRRNPAGIEMTSLSPYYTLARETEGGFSALRFSHKNDFTSSSQGI